MVKKSIDEIHGILVQFLGDSEKINYNKNGQTRFHCPKCRHHNKKLEVNIGLGIFHCWICNFSGSILKLAKYYGNNNQFNQLKSYYNKNDIENDIVKEKINKTKINLYNISSPILIDSKDPFRNKALNYLKNRNISNKDIIKYNIHYSIDGKYKNRIIFPSYDSFGNINYFVGRSFLKIQKPKYLNPPTNKNIIFNEIYIDWNEDVILTEGLIDSIKIGDNSIPILGSSLDDTSRLFDKLYSMPKNKKKIIALDKDANLKSMKIAYDLLKYNIKNIYIVNIDNIPYDDFGEFKSTRSARKYIFDNMELVNQNILIENTMLKELESI